MAEVQVRRGHSWMGVRLALLLVGLVGLGGLLGSTPRRATL